MRRILTFLFLFFLAAQQLAAQTKTQHENTGWLFFLNSTKLNDKWSMHLDVQLRSADGWTRTKNILFRPGLTYHINTKQNLTAGYLLATNDLGALKLTEHRLWEQYIITHKIASVFTAHRFRLEQRFLDQTGDNFTQRLRYFVRFIQPLQKREDAFTKGVFLALQNEVFFNIQNKQLINNSLLDQNRLYLAAGYRLSKQFDLEAGYLNQSIKGMNHNTVNHVAQLAIYTRF